MKFFIDTANLDQIKDAQDLGVLDGVTTNPSLMAKEGITGADNILNHYKAICAIVDGDVSAEVIATDFEGMVREGEALAALNPQIVVKLPMIKAGVKACKYFSDKGIKTNVTLVFSVGQAILAAKAGATYVSPLLDVWMISLPMVLILLLKYVIFMITTALRPKFWPLLFAIPCMSLTVPK